MLTRVTPLIHRRALNFATVKKFIGGVGIWICLQEKTETQTRYPLLPLVTSALNTKSYAAWWTGSGVRERETGRPWLEVKDPGQTEEAKEGDTSGNVQTTACGHCKQLSLLWVSTSTFVSFPQHGLCQITAWS